MFKRKKTFKVGDQVDYIGMEPGLVGITGTVLYGPGQAFNRKDECIVNFGDAVNSNRGFKLVKIKYLKKCN